MHLTLKSGTGYARKNWFTVGDYKKIPNEVGGNETVLPSEVPAKRSGWYPNIIQKSKAFEDIIEFHYNFECIHPFQDGNGRIGRLIIFKECLKHNIVPFIIGDNLKMYYYRGLNEWPRERGYLLDTCLSAQGSFKAYLDYFKIPYED